MSWSQIEAEAAARKKGRFPLRAYSEFMPAPFVGGKPYDRSWQEGSATLGVAKGGDATLDITEYERVQELDPGLTRIAQHLVAQLAKLLRGQGHALSHTLLDGNPAWPAELSEAARRGQLAAHPIVLLAPLALSRTQDDKGNVRWTLFGASHDGAAAFGKCLPEGDAGRAELARVVTWARGGVRAGEGLTGVRGFGAEVPAWLEPVGHVQSGCTCVVTFAPFASLPEWVRRGYLARTIELLPSPASLIFYHHPRYAQLAHELPHAEQVPLLHLFPRVQGGYHIRIPQSGWFDEPRPGQTHAQAKAGNPHQVVATVERSHRWQRVERDSSAATTSVDPEELHKVAVALFSSDPDHLGLYGKPMARNAQIWSESYRLLLDGPNADAAKLEAARRAVDGGGRFGYRFVFPAMRAGERELYWHRPLIARLAADGAKVERLDHTFGYVTAERPGAAPIVLQPRQLARPGHSEAATQFADPGRVRFTTSNNVRQLLSFAELLGQPLPPSLVRRLVHIAKTSTFDEWLAQLPAMATDAEAGRRLAEQLRGLVSQNASALTAPLTFAQTTTRDFEESIWRSIAELAEGQLRAKETADALDPAVNAGKHGGPAAVAARLDVAEDVARSDLRALGDHLHDRYRALFAAHGMSGRAQVVDHVFQWETDFDFSWSRGWAQNQSGQARERNVVCVIPGRDRGLALVMGDHYDTAYMEDVFEAARGGDGLRAAAHGADDNHSATTALLRAAEILLPLAREGKLARDVWLVHLTGEEFPSDCLGARALARALCEERLTFTDEAGQSMDVSQVRVAGAFILDMIGHNNDRDRDVFQIAPGEGAASARLALRAHLANERWNAQVPAWNRAQGRHGRAQRMVDGSTVPPPFAHLALAGEIRSEWEPRSSLYNTDGQIFSDVGIPVVLFMENYDINRTGYHDTHDTMKNIDLDYCAALTAIAIETVTDCALADTL